MNKQQVIDELNARGIPHDETKSKAELQALLHSSAPSPSESAGEGETKKAAATEAGESLSPGVAVGNRRHDEDLIAEKMAAGLRRDQAEEVIANQRAFDAGKS